MDLSLWLKTGFFSLFLIEATPFPSDPDFRGATTQRKSLNSLVASSVQEYSNNFFVRSSVILLSFKGYLIEKIYTQFTRKKDDLCYELLNSGYILFGTSTFSLHMGGEGLVGEMDSRISPRTLPL